MSRLLAAAVTAAFAAALAVGAAFGIVALLGITPDQPNDPLVTFPAVTAEGTPAPSARPSPSSLGPSPSSPSGPPSSSSRPSSPGPSPSSSSNPAPGGR
ncbi:hypothetical protein AB0I22_21525 [Streptomyces sp. NPDC050610]|uniref:hypothetical protein n=1 Tax=Streptomyces sp. NPDC050610 TaxID=3157097 RepID=UPI0034456632